MGVLDDKVAIVTGSARGIGRATAELLSEHGAKVLINDLDADLAEQTASEIDGETVVYGGDLTQPGAPDALVQTAIDAWGRLDIIVNNAGYTIDAPIHKMSDDAFQRMLDIHTIVPFRIIRAAAPHLREPAKAERERGEEVFRKIVNVSSISGTMGNAGQANYSAGKSAVVGITKTLAKEWGQFKINVNAVAFGWIETRLTASKVEDNTMEIGGEKVQLGIPDQMRGMASMLIPLGRTGTPEEAAGGVFFLCSPWSNFVHGQVLEHHRRAVHRDDHVARTGGAPAVLRRPARFSSGSHPRAGELDPVEVAVGVVRLRRTAGDLAEHQEQALRPGVVEVELLRGPGGVAAGRLQPRRRDDRARRAARADLDVDAVRAGRVVRRTTGEPELDLLVHVAQEVGPVEADPVARREVAALLARPTSSGSLGLTTLVFVPDCSNTNSTC